MSKFGSKIEFFGFENPTHNFRAIHLKMKETFILIDTLFRHMRRGAVTFGAGFLLP